MKAVAVRYFRIIHSLPEKRRGVVLETTNRHSCSRIIREYLSELLL